MGEIYVVGKTTEREAYVASVDRAFIIDEHLMVTDSDHDNPVGEVVETAEYALVGDHTFAPETGITESLKSAFKNLSRVYIGKIKFLEEWQTPIASHSRVEVPDFKKVESLLISKYPDEGFTLGVIQGTGSLLSGLPEELRDITPLLLKGQIVAQNGVPFILDHYSFREYPHIGLFGGSGSGKTHGLRVICEEIMGKRIPGIALDPHFELSFDTPMAGLPDDFVKDFSRRHEVFQIGKNVGIDFTDLSTEEILSLLEYIGNVSQPMRGAIEQLHEPKDSFTSLINRVNRLKMAFDNMEKPRRDQEDLPEDVVLLYQKNRDKVAGSDTLQAVSWRLDRLQKTGIFETDISEVENCLMKRKLAVIRGKQRHLKMISSYLIGKLYKKRRAYIDFEQKGGSGRNDEVRPQKFPPFFVVMDEAHNFAPSGEYMNPIKRVLREISQEARKYGVFEVFGTQRPALLDTTITAQLNTKIIFRTGIKSDMEMIKTETNLSDNEVKRLPDLSSGNAFVSSATLRKTQYIRFRVSHTVSPHSKHPFDELDAFDENHLLKDALLCHMPLSSEKIPKVHSDINNVVKRSVSVKEINETLAELVDEGRIALESSPFGNRYIDAR